MKRFKPSAICALTLVETLIVLGLLSATAGVGVQVIRNIKTTAEEAKLTSDVESLNRSVAVYLGSGGSLTGVTNATAVINKLKTRSDAASAAGALGMTGSFVDSRVTPVTMNSTLAASTQIRAQWNGTISRFQTTRSAGQSGIKEFTLTDSLSAAAPTLEARQNSLVASASTDPRWIWDYVDRSASQDLPGYALSGIAIVENLNLIGTFTVGKTGIVTTRYIFREAGYSSRLGLFSLEGMDVYDLNTAAGLQGFILEAVRRVLNTDGSNFGNVIVDASTTTAGNTPRSYQFRPDDVLAAILIPNASFETAYAAISGWIAGGAVPNSQTFPLLSITLGNNTSAPFYQGQIASLGGDFFAIEDIPGSTSDFDYNDLIFDLQGIEQGTSNGAIRQIDPLTYYTQQTQWNNGLRAALIAAGAIPPGTP